MWACHVAAEYQRFMTPEDTVCCGSVQRVRFIVIKLEAVRLEAQ